MCKKNVKISSIYYNYYGEFVNLVKKEVRYASYEEIYGYYLIVLITRIKSFMKLTLMKI